MRFLPNPHYEPDLRELTGLDQRVVDYVGRDGRLEELYERLHPLLDFLLPQYVAEGKAHLMIAVGCTGGRHRSVAIAEQLAARYRGQDGHRRDGRAPRHRQGAARVLTRRLYEGWYQCATMFGMSKQIAVRLSDDARGVRGSSRSTQDPDGVGQRSSQEPSNGSAGARSRREMPRSSPRQARMQSSLSARGVRIRPPVAA